MKSYLEGLNAIHDADHVYRRCFPDVDRKYPAPAIRSFAPTGLWSQLLFVNRLNVTHVVGVSKAESTRY